MDDFCVVFKKFQCLFDGKLQYLKDILMVIGNFQCFFIKSHSIADFAHYFHISQKMHAQLNGSGSHTIFATASGIVKRKSALLIATF